MDRVILDAETIGKLNGLTEVLELYGEDGEFIGHIVPVRGRDADGPDPFITVDAPG